MTFRQRVFARLALTSAAAVMLTGFALGRTAHAQDATETPPVFPIVFYGSGLTLMDAETGELTPWPECPDSSELRLSPNGAWLAQRGQNGQVVLCEFASGEAITVGEETEGVEWPSLPAWSPDASAVAWTLTVDGEQTLYVYDLATETTTALVEGLPTPSVLPQVVWGKSGIIVANDSPVAQLRWTALFSTDGTLIYDQLANDDYPTRYGLIIDDYGKEYLQRTGEWTEAVDLETFRVWFTGYIWMFSPLAPDGMGIIVNSVYPNVSVNLPDGEKFTINSFDEALSDFMVQFTPEPRNLAISPDGTAFVVRDVVAGLWRGGELETLPDGIPAGDGSGVLWGPVSYRLRNFELGYGAK